MTTQDTAAQGSPAQDSSTQDRAARSDSPPVPVTTIVVCDGMGIGAAADAGTWNSRGADTLAHTAAAVGGLHLPTLERWGLGHLGDIAGVNPVAAPEAVVATARMRSAGCDTPSGHWELFGRVSNVAAPVYPNGFDDDLLSELCDAWGVDGVLANCAVGGLEVLDRWGDEHVESGRPIVYTSADSVLQVAAHTKQWNLEQLWDNCATARRICDEAGHRIGRIIARPFTGTTGHYSRLGADRRDWSVPAPADGAIDRLHAAGIRTVAIGKIGDIFAHRGFTVEEHPENLDGLIDAIDGAAATLRRDGDGGVIIINIVDFDYRGHARDPYGWAGIAERVDIALGAAARNARAGDRIVVCADHGNDPTHTVDDNGDAHLDHTREHTPLIMWQAGTAGASIGAADMADLGTSLCAWYGVDSSGLDGTVLDGTDLNRTT